MSLAAFAEKKTSATMTVLNPAEWRAPSAAQPVTCASGERILRTGPTQVAAHLGNLSQSNTAKGSIDATVVSPSPSLHSVWNDSASNVKNPSGRHI
jgi:hypothetical protein